MGLSQVAAVLTCRKDEANKVLVVVNASFGAIVGTGLVFIGVPNALLLWGVLAGRLRSSPMSAR